MQPQQNPYDFISQNNQAPKKSLLGAMSRPIKLLLIAGGLLLVTLLIFMISQLTGGDSARDTLRTAVQQQTEILRITSLQDIRQASSRSLQNATATITSTISSDQKSLESALSARRIKFTSKEIALGRRASTTESISTAAAAGTLTTTAIGIYQSELRAYMTTLQSAYDQSSSAGIRDALQTSYNNADMLLKLLDQ